MKEITIKLADKIADYVARDADSMGITSEDLIKFIIGAYVQAEIMENSMLQHRGIAIPINIGEILDRVFGSLDERLKSMVTGGLKKAAEEGALSCKNCTMKLTPEDIDAGKCGSCGATLKEALGVMLE